MTLNEYLHKADAQYDPAACMILAPAHGPGYHTRIADGTPSHATREAMDYAIALLQSRETPRGDRACDIIDKVCSLQQTDPTDSHYGIWGWFLEEPPKEMNPADWNWADFIGSRLAQVLRLHAPQFRPATADAARVALHHAAWSIFRRNVTASYTNIAVMGAVVAAAAGELLAQIFLVEYARQRLANVIALLESTGGLNEYNSPTYTRVVLEETERALMLVSDEQIRADAEKLRVVAWRTFAEHYHPATGQIGPCSRAYSDWITPRLNRYLAEQTGASIPLRGANTGDDGVDLVTPLPCPADIASRFRGLPELPHQIVCRFGKNVRGDTIGTTWFAEDACLGTVNRDHTWNQRRPLLAYWRTERDQAICLRVRVLKSGRDFAPCYLYQAQDGPRVLGGFSLAYGAGDFHPTFDRRDEYALTDLRARFSLAGDGATVRDLGEGRFKLSAGDWSALLHTPASPCTIGDREIQWRVSTGPAGEACVDAILYEGPEHLLDGRSTPLQLGFALELLRRDQEPTSQRPHATRIGDEIQWTWGKLTANAPAMPVPFTW